VTRPILYLTAPYQTATEGEKALRLEAVRVAVARGWCPVFSPFLLERAYPEETPEVRVLALDCCLALLAVATALLVVGERRTEGMNVELSWWEEHGDAPMLWPDLPRAEEWANT